ncbi:MAG: ribosome-binding factor A, partial [Nitrospinae bacterium]|nr:ribosome-binding factor A [Nitrospinota bacterium]
MKRFQRSDRVSEELLREISQIVLREMKDPRLSTAGLVSFTRVDLTKDLRNATVYVSIFGK